VALPGERLARAGGLTEADLAAAEVFTLDEVADGTTGANGEAGTTDDRGDDGEPRRRRRRGGRGRGRGRGRADEASEDLPAETPAARTPAERAPIAPARAVEEDEDVVPARRAPRTTPFGSVWDTQLGTPTAPAAASLAPITDDEDFDEPEIPEYLIAEQRRGAQRGGGSGRGARGGRSAYQSAMERERFGRGGGGGGGQRGGASHGSTAIRTCRLGLGRRTGREDRGYGRQEREPGVAARGSNEPWSDVPPGWRRCSELRSPRRWPRQPGVAVRPDLAHITCNGARADSGPDDGGGANKGTTRAEAEHTLRARRGGGRGRRCGRGGRRDQTRPKASNDSRAKDRARGDRDAFVRSGRARGPDGRSDRRESCAQGQGGRQAADHAGAGSPQVHGRDGV
jgi:hypothetical protein